MRFPDDDAPDLLAQSQPAPNTKPAPPPPVELCRVCFRVMTEMAGYDARANVAGVGGLGSPDSGGGLGSFFSSILSAFGWVGAGAKQKKFDEIVAQYPYSLFCPNCGEIVKRKDPPKRDDEAPLKPTIKNAIADEPDIPLAAPQPHARPLNLDGSADDN